ncbi:hypothetical protein FGB62_190g020 [Gracilaria domingensis]|nr:hypothetical protein FGB62_190g020 [Gracilaria domingensis]
MNQAKQPSPGTSRPLSPHLLQVHRDSLVSVFLEASVTDSERLHFDVPPKNIETALSSLVLTDSRGTTPSIFVHSPVTVEVANEGSEETWLEVMNRYQGARIGIECAHDKTEGILIGFRQEHYNSSENSGARNHSSFFIISRSGSKVSLHPIDSVISLNFQDQAICEALSQDSFMKQYVVRRRDMYKIELVTHGSGLGHVEVRYSMRSRYETGYEVNYVFALDDDEGVYACGLRSKRNLKCYFTLHNPIPGNLSNVQVEFCSGKSQYDRYYWPYSDLEAKTKRDDDAQSVSDRTESSKERSTRISEQEVEEDFTDDFSEISSSTTERVNYAEQGNVIQRFPQKVSLKMNESVRLLMFERLCTGGIIRTILTQQDEACADVSLLLHNTTKENLEAGHLHVKSSCVDLSQQFHISPIAPGEYVLRQLSRYSDIEWNTHKQVDIGAMRSCHVSEKQLIVVTDKTKTMIGRIQNKSDREVDLFVLHYLRSTGRRKGAVEGTLTKGSWLRAEKGKKMEPYSHSIDLRSVGYTFKLGRYETCWITIRERLTFEQKHMILEELESATICNLEVQQILPPTALQSLRRLLSLGRESEHLTLEQTLHRKKLRKIEAYRTAKRKETGAGEGGKEGQNGKGGARGVGGAGGRERAQAGRGPPRDERDQAPAGLPHGVIVIPVQCVYPLYIVP